MNKTKKFIPLSNYIPNNNTIEKSPQSSILTCVISGITDNPDNSSFKDQKEITHYSKNNTAIQLIKETSKNIIGFSMSEPPIKKNHQSTLLKFLYWINRSIYSKCMEAGVLKETTLTLDLADLVEYGTYMRPDKAKAGFKTVEKALFSMYIGYRIIDNGVIEPLESSDMWHLFRSFKLTGSKLTILLEPNAPWDYIYKYITIYPKCFLSLQPNATILATLIAEEIKRQDNHLEQNGYIKISMNRVIKRLGLTINNKRFSQLVIEPIEKAIEELETQTQNEYFLFELDYTVDDNSQKNKNNFLNGFLKVNQIKLVK